VPARTRSTSRISPFPADSPVVGRTLDALNIRRVTGVTILAILREGNPLVSPPGDFALSRGDQLLALGTGEQLAKLDRLIHDRIAALSGS
jgi:CPA2 family monovalent cation:H+ antiporter-2